MMQVKLTTTPFYRLYLYNLKSETEVRNYLMQNLEVIYSILVKLLILNKNEV